MFLIIKNQLSKSETDFVKKLLESGKAVRLAEVPYHATAASQPDNPPAPHDPLREIQSKAARFVDRCTQLARAVSELNGPQAINDRGRMIAYSFNFDGPRFIKMFNQFADKHYDDIAAILARTSSPDGITLVASFFGIVIDQRIFNSAVSLRKSTVLPVFEKLFPDSKSARTRLSRRPMSLSHPVNMLGNQFLDFVQNQNL